MESTEELESSVERSLPAVEESLWNFVEDGEEVIPLDLHTAASIGDNQCIEQFGKVSCREKLNETNKGGWTALMYACYVGHVSVTKTLLDLNTEVNSVTRNGSTPLMLAAFSGNKQICQVLLQHGAMIDCQDVHGQTALFHATHMGHTNVLEFLLEVGANTELREIKSGFTALLEAAKNGREKVFNILLEHGANLSVRTHKQESVRDIALRYNMMTIVNMIDYPSFKGDLRGEPGLLCDDLGSEEQMHSERKVHRWLGGQDPKEHQSGIRDGPEAFAKITHGIPFGSPRDRMRRVPLSHSPYPGVRSGMPFPSQYTLSPPAMPCYLGTSPDDHFFMHSANTVRSVQLHEGFAQCNMRNNHDTQSSENQQPIVVPMQHNTGHQSRFPVTTSTPTLAEFLDDLKLTKYLKFFEAKNIDFEAFLNLTDDNLKEIGIELFGPRKKMSIAINKWKTQQQQNQVPGRADSGVTLVSTESLQQTAQASDISVQFQQALANVSHIEAQLVQEKNLRSVVEAYLIEEKAKRQNLYRVCGDAYTYTMEVDSHLKTLIPLIKRCIELSKSQSAGEGSESDGSKVLEEVITSKLELMEQAVNHALKKLEVITKEDTSGVLLNSSGSNTSGSSSDCLVSKLDKLSV